MGRVVPSATTREDSPSERRPAGLGDGTPSHGSAAATISQSPDWAAERPTAARALSRHEMLAASVAGTRPSAAAGATHVLLAVGIVVAESRQVLGELAQLVPRS
eukprot:CAMPEP_0115827534 /NCGR_PEP_ID=MMETSP0287-20121206/95_1 /TAXON_ID=412157 /ORGANISM="Chrysochromulina rotalis, Strain UIO044" /LENGTH=103 /DNA_ID=CAMNT_0003280697 /DNA_START=430 /DNA_END=739 /DNA_ORIENTATION=+